MSASQYRSQLERKRAQRLEAEKKAAAARSKESEKRASATKARTSASASKSDSTIRMKLREADRHETDANSAGKDSASWQLKATGYLKDEMTLSKQLADAEAAERRAADKKRETVEKKRDSDEKKRIQVAAAAEKRREQQAAQASRETARLHGQLAAQINSHEYELASLRKPRQEKLRLLMLASSGAGDLRVAREQKRIQDAVRFASGRDSVVLDLRPAATSGDLLDGLTQGRPHIVHFSGHGDETVVVFEQDVDAPNSGWAVRGDSLAAALRAVDEPPLLVVLNACSSAQQAERITQGVASFAIGHSDSIGDADAIAYAARFYASLADGQSIQAAHDIAKAALSLQGLPDADLPTLFSDAHLDPATIVLVLPSV